MTYFQTDKSGATWHRILPASVMVVAVCGVNNERTQWTRYADERPSKVCGRCS